MAVGRLELHLERALVRLERDRVAAARRRDRERVADIRDDVDVCYSFTCVVTSVLVLVLVDTPST